MSTEQRIEILSQEYHRCQTDPLYAEPEKYCIILDLIYDELDRLMDLNSQFKMQELINRFGEVN